MSIAMEFPLEAADPHCLTLGTAGALLADAPWRRLVVVGDSIAQGVREPVEGYRDSGFADRVGEAFAQVHPDFDYLNLGRRGLRLAEIRDTQLEPALDFEPDLAMVAGGGNDAIHPSFDEESLRRGLEDVILPLRERGATVVTVGLFDLARSGLLDEPYATQLAERFDLVERVTAELAAAHGCVHADSHHHPRAADPGVFASDLMHCNARGHAIAEANVVRALAEAARV